VSVRIAWPSAGFRLKNPKQSVIEIDFLSKNTQTIRLEKFPKFANKTAFV